VAAQHFATKSLLGEMPCNWLLRENVCTAGEALDRFLPGGGPQPKEGVV